MTRIILVKKREGAGWDGETEAAEAAQALPEFMSRDDYIHPFIRAAGEGQTKILQWFLEDPDFDPDSVRFKGYTALQAATLKVQPHVVRHLLRYGANVNALDDFGETSLDLVDSMMESDMDAFPGSPYRALARLPPVRALLVRQPVYDATSFLWPFSVSHPALQPAPPSEPAPDTGAPRVDSTRATARLSNVSVVRRRVEDSRQHHEGRLRPRAVLLGLYR